MARGVLNVEEFLTADRLACLIAKIFQEWKNTRLKKEADWLDVTKFVFAIDTTTTPNSKLPWKNKTTRPKLCQIRDNLHANYMAALFPNDQWFNWEGADYNSVDKDKAMAIRMYMANKLKESKFEETVSRLVLDFIDYGNVFGDTEYVTETFKNSRGETVPSYIGPRAVRISPYDVLFDITAPSFERAAKISRALVTMGDIKKLMKSNEAWARVSPEIIEKISHNRRAVAGYSNSDMKKQSQFIADGFGSLNQYYASGLIEVLEFEGDMYNSESGEFKENRIITIVDRAYVVRDEPIETWTGRSTKLHCGWRLRPDNLMAMGPLDNLVGMQYRIDHLENLKADVFDLIAYPVFKVKGHVEDFEYGPLERIYMEQESDVEMMRPDTTALNADIQIQELEAQMEEMAGAPKNAMGIRTPGEKTKFEVQTLDNAASRVFQSKISYFEKYFLEPMLNSMLELARRNISAVETIRVIDSDIGVIKFLEITKADLESKGKLVPMGARHFAAQAQLIQNLTTLAGTGLYQDPSVNVHFSGLRLAQLIEDNLGLAQYKIVEPNVRIVENAETQNLASSASEQTQINSMTPTMTEEDIPDDPAEEDGQEGGEAF